MSDIQSNNKRIARNTIFLYIRMFITMIVGLYTSRVVLQMLGVEDFGIYNVIGGIVMMCAFISNTMGTASQRFFAYEIGQGNYTQLKKVFAATVNIYIVFAVLILFFAETIGLWFVNHHLNIPIARIEAAQFIYQFSIFSFIFTILRIPYNAAIIAREKMSFYAWISIVETSLKLLIVFMLVCFDFDKLKLYAILTLAVVTVVSSVYYLYCKIKFSECRFSIVLDKALYQSLFSFAGWNLFGSIANVGLDQGLNILINIFFGPAVNTARGIAFQIKSQVSAFVGNFQTAASPQIIKYYSSGDLAQMKLLLFRSSRMSYYLMFLISLPVLLEMDVLLSWWLYEIPPYTTLFAQLVVINTNVDCMSGTIIPAVQATGKIKLYQCVVGLTLLLALPLSYLFLKLGYPPEVTMVITIILSAVALFARLVILRRLLGIKIAEYLKEVVWFNIVISLIGALIPCWIKSQLSTGVVSFFIVCIASVVCTSLAIYIFGLTKEERQKINIIRKR